eukprot:scaffold5380_cov131-Cylindrotheca_fusiformis.AAC.23
MLTHSSGVVAFGKQFVFEQRAVEIATRGWSTTKLPKKGLTKPPADKLAPIVNKIMCAIEHQDEILLGLTIRLYQTSRLAMKIVKGNPDMAASTMLRVKSIQAEYVHNLRVKAGMEAYLQHVENGLQDFKNVERVLEELKSVRWNKSNPKDYPKDVLLTQLKHELFFPRMDTKGKISYGNLDSLSQRVVTSSEFGSSSFSQTSSTRTDNSSNGADDVF